MAKVSRALGITEQTLRNWLQHADQRRATGPGAGSRARTQPNAAQKHTFVVNVAAIEGQQFSVEAADLRTALTRAEARFDVPNQIISITRLSGGMPLA